jgi:DNA polymerase III delta prime subunit
MDTRKICLEGTRNEILNEITAWINNPVDNTRVFWLHGNAGTGKSSIAHTIAYRFKKLGRLGSCYCLNRNEMAEQRDKNIFTTIARDLADRDKQMRRELVAAVHLDTSLKNTSDILQQWNELIMKPALKLSSMLWMRAAGLIRDNTSFVFSLASWTMTKAAYPSFLPTSGFFSHHDPCQTSTIP